MKNLDSAEEIKKIDKGNVWGSILELPDQMLQAWEETKTHKVPETCKLSKNVVVAGMGGSALGGRIVDSLVADKARVPIEVFTEFRLPNYVNKDSFVILSSYSGNTEEILTVGREALNRGASIFCLATGGKLQEFMKENSLDGYIFEPKHNPSNQPRMGLGYAVVGVLAALAKCEFINLLESELFEAIEDLRTFISDPAPAQKLAVSLQHKIPVLVASEHLVGSAHAFKNQLNENAKTFACLFDLPELNHHLMEGLTNPTQAKKLLHFVFLESEVYSREVKIRYPLTQEVVKKNGVGFEIYQTRFPRKLPQILEILALGSLVSFYLALLYDLDPSPIPWVDYFKKALGH
jgi:glucose/mannose-6-phosphate isomerase